MSDNFQRGDAETQRKPFGHWSLVIGLIFVVALAGFLRFYRLNDLPPGMWFDEAWSAIAARDTAAQGVFPPYFAASFGGMHPAIVYLTRFANMFTGGHPLTIRYALAVVGTLTVLLSFFSYRAIFNLKIKDARLKIDADEQSLIINHQSSLFALLGAFILAITFPFLLFTRMGFESSLVALASLLLFYCLAVALRKGKAGWYVLTGVVLGLSLYSFDTARFLPFAVSLAYWGVVLLHRREEDLRRHLLNFVWLTVAALVAFVPMGSYFFRNWGQFTERAGITTYNTLGPGAESVSLALLNNTWRTLGGLSLTGFGDVIARHNLPGRPVFDVFLSILFWLGVGVLIWKWKRPFAIILISWAGVMLLPVILTDGAPTYTRILGAIPALAAIAALSFSIPDAVKRLTNHDLRLPIYGMLGVLLLLSLGATTYDYFVRWAAEPALFDQFQVADWQAANLASERLATDTVYLMPDLIDEAHPTFDLVLGGSEVRTFGADCLVVQGDGERPLTYFIKPSSAPDTLPTLQTLYPEGQAESPIISPLTGEELFSVFSLQSPVSSLQSPVSSLQSPIAQFGDDIQLSEQSEIEVVDGTIAIPLIWKSLGQPTADHTYFIHLYRAGAEDEPPVAQLDQQPCLPTNQWHQGEIVMETAVLSLPPDLPPGDYTLGLGWYTWPSFERLPLRDSEVALPDQRHMIGVLTLE